MRTTCRAVIPEVHPPQRNRAPMRPAAPCLRGPIEVCVARDSVQTAAAAPAPAPAPALPAAVQLAQNKYQQQTLIQPDAPKDLILQHPTPVPLVMMWNRRQEPVKSAVASPPSKPVIANLHSSLARPNRESAPAAINLSSTNFHAAMPTLAPGTTSPLVDAPAPIRRSRCPSPRRSRIHLPLRCASSRSLTVSSRRGPWLCRWPTPARVRPHRNRLRRGKSEGQGGTGSAASSGEGRQQSRRIRRRKMRVQGGGAGAATPVAGRRKAVGQHWRCLGKARACDSVLRPGYRAGERKFCQTHCVAQEDGQFGVVVVGIFAGGPVSGDGSHLGGPAGLHRLSSRRNGQELDSAIFDARGQSVCRPRSSPGRSMAL